MLNLIQHVNLILFLRERDCIVLRNPAREGILAAMMHPYSSRFPTFGKESEKIDFCKNECKFLRNVASTESFASSYKNLHPVTPHRRKIEKHTSCPKNGLDTPDKATAQHNYRDHAFQRYAFLPADAEITYTAVSRRPISSSVSASIGLTSGSTGKPHSKKLVDFAASQATAAVAMETSASRTSPCPSFVTVEALESARSSRFPPRFSPDDRRTTSYQTKELPIISSSRFYRKRTSLNSFPQKLYSMLETTSSDDKLQQIVSWQPHGRCFISSKPDELSSQLLARYFRHGNLASFRRQLNIYGFKRITRGPDHGAYYHELFLRGRPLLCRLITRIGIKGNKVKPASNPAAEPNFYMMKPCHETDKFKALDALAAYGVNADIDTTRQDDYREVEAPPAYTTADAAQEGEREATATQHASEIIFDYNSNHTSPMHDYHAKTRAVAKWTRTKEVVPRDSDHELLVVPSYPLLGVSGRETVLGWKRSRRSIWAKFSNPPTFEDQNGSAYFLREDEGIKQYYNCSDVAKTMKSAVTDEKFIFLKAGQFSPPLGNHGEGHIKCSSAYCSSVGFPISSICYRCDKVASADDCTLLRCTSIASYQVDAPSDTKKRSFNVMSIADQQKIESSSSLSNDYQVHSIDRKALEAEKCRASFLLLLSEQKHPQDETESINVDARPVTAVEIKNEQRTNSDSATSLFCPGGTEPRDGDDDDPLCDREIDSVDPMMLRAYEARFVSKLW